MPILTLLTSAFGNERYNAAAMPDELGQVRVIPVLQDEGVAFPGESRASWAMTRWPDLVPGPGQAKRCWQTVAVPAPCCVSNPAAHASAARRSLTPAISCCLCGLFRVGRGNT
jgi:hypothetical protein